MDCSHEMEFINTVERDTEKATAIKEHALKDDWVLWAHLPHNTDWSMKSFIQIDTINTVERVLALNNYIPGEFIQNCMLFYMRKGIDPIWEDPNNCNGGCFTFKIFNKDVPKLWKDLMCVVSGETLSDDADFNTTVNGITVSPKRTFCIIKVWMKTNKYQNFKKIRPLRNLSTAGCKFKKHQESYK